MPLTPARLPIPPGCHFCGFEGGVMLTTTVKAGEIALSWTCRHCGKEWPVTRGEMTAR